MPGSARVSRIIDLDPFILPLTGLLPSASLDDLEDVRELLAGTHLDYENATLHLAVQSHLVRIGGRTILIDTCVGEDKPRSRRPDWHERRQTGYLSRLAAAGCRPEDIDLVMCTHLHADHVGWNTRLENGRWVPTFPKARYLIGRTELAFWSERAAQPADYPLNHGSLADSVLPVIEAGLADLIDDGAQVAPGVTILPLPGHTPGHAGLEIAEPGQPSLVFSGDALHSPVQVVHPGWSSAFCTDPAMAATSRIALLERAAETDTVLIPAHLRGEGMRISRMGARFRPRFCGCDGR
ncbi:MAG: MBL fold metallo-hydrolase [Beijerinckiaceae bacterium]|jgi:glyoxylase-like metal-dependent hydrolase (beta-lactamase superfamily II)|nr:MBL fold metallo-hydrolase [Beijerinckiaceae bacterium]